MLENAIDINSNASFLRHNLEIAILALFSPHGLSLGGEDLLDVGEALVVELLPPADVVCDEVEVLAALAAHDDDALLVGLARDGLRVARRAHLARVDQLQAALHPAQGQRGGGGLLLLGLGERVLGRLRAEQAIWLKQKPIW